MSPPAFERAEGRKKQKKQKKKTEKTEKKQNRKEAAEGGVDGTGKRCAAAAGGGERSAAGGAKRAKNAEAGGAAWALGHDKVKGRVMVATRALAVGEVILDEQPLVAASWHAHRCIECHLPHASSTCPEVARNFPPAVAKAMDQIEQALGGIEGIDELDIARRLIKLLNIARQQPERAELTRPCTAHNMDKCRAVIAAIRAHKLARAILPAGVEDEEAARLLAVLNTNSHELAEWGGSGFFPLACLCEHSCQPNCAFNTSGTALWITVVRPVEKGSTLSIDYCDSTFEPTAERRDHLLQDYGFECLCARCTSLPDLTRAFLCPVDGCAGKVCPVALGAKPSDWKCLTCRAQLPKTTRKRFLKIEAALAQEPPADLEEIDEVLEHDVFHESHHVILDSLVEIGEHYAKDDGQVRSGAAEAIWERVIDLSDQVLPAVHPRKAIWFDNLAQVPAMSARVTRHP